MKRVEKIGVVLLISGVAVGCWERPEIAYPDLQAAKDAGAIERGWIPVWIPPTSYDLRETHDLDSNRSMLAFKYSPRDAPRPLDVCAEVHAGQLQDVPFRVSWWPADVPPTSVVASQFAFYSCEDGRALLAVSALEGEAYYWRP